jgi:hypothetical protein
MEQLTTTLKRLRDERRDAQQQVEKLDEAIKAIEGLGRRGGQPKRKLSAAARRRIAHAQKARWKKWRRQKRRS